MVRKPLGWLYWFIAALFFAYEWMHRVAPSVLTGALRQDLNVNSHQVGMIAAMYFYAYAAFQLPAGLLIDKYGAKNVLGLASLSVTLGSLLFTVTHDLHLLYLSRFIIGAGSAFAFVGCLRIGGLWLIVSSFPFVVGLTNLFGTLGALSGGQPLSFMVLSLGWRTSFMWITLIGAVITLLIYFIIPRASEYQSTEQHYRFLDGLKWVITSPQAWLIGFFAALVVAPIAAIPELWGVEFLTTAYQIDGTRASSMTHSIFLGTAIGGALIGWFSTQKNTLTIMRVATFIALVLLCTFVYWLPNHYVALYLIFFCFGIFSANMLLCFSLISKLCPPWAQGAAIGFVNMIIMIIAGCIQHGIGVFLDILIFQHEGQYQLNDYHIALSVLPLGLSVAIILTLFIKTGHKVN